MTRHALHGHVIVRIWIDAGCPPCACREGPTSADACPRDVKDVVFRASARLQIAVVLVANKNIAVPLSPPTTTSRKRRRAATSSSERRRRAACQEKIRRT
jgi:hypothetical protein